MKVGTLDVRFGTSAPKSADASLHRHDAAAVPDGDSTHDADDTINGVAPDEGGAPDTAGQANVVIAGDASRSPASIAPVHVDIA